jgi:hypothetical protein
LLTRAARIAVAVTRAFVAPAGCFLADSWTS